MNYVTSPLYGITKKKDLLGHLHLKRSDVKTSHIVSSIKPALKYSGQNVRLIESTSVSSIKNAQRVILKDLQYLDYPPYLYSGLKGKSYIDNARVHIKCDYLFKIDISKFFPSITREKVYRVFSDGFHCSSDVSKILADLTTINIDNYTPSVALPIIDYLSMSGVTTHNHLMTGASPSILLSYLSNVDMFEELFTLSEKYGVIMSVYVDDIFFSCQHPIPKWFRNKVITIINNNGYSISKDKTRYYKKGIPKEVTGVIITSNHTLALKHKQHFLIGKKLKVLNREKNHDIISSLKGSLLAAKQVDDTVFPNLSNYLSNK